MKMRLLRNKLLIAFFIVAQLMVMTIPTLAASVIATVPVGVNPFGVGVNPTTNLIYVSNQNSNNVSVIDGITNTVVATVGVGNIPNGVGVNPNTNFIYVANNSSNNVSVINGNTNAIVATVTVGTS